MLLILGNFVERLVPQELAFLQELTKGVLDDDLVTSNALLSVGGLNEELVMTLFFKFGMK